MAEDGRAWGHSVRLLGVMTLMGKDQVCSV